MSESTEHKEVVAWFRSTWPEYRRSIRASMSGLNLGSGKRGSQLTNYMRAHGVEKGESDILIALKRGPYGSLVLEYKAADGMYEADSDQISYVSYHNEIGNLGLICRGVDVAKAAITQYMELPLES